MTRAIVVFAIFNALLFASLGGALWFVGSGDIAARAMAASVFLFGEMFIVAGTIGPAIMRWMADE